MSDSKIEDIILRSIDKIDVKMDKVEDKINGIQRKMDIVEERQENSIKHHSSHESLVESLHKSLTNHIKKDEGFQESIVDKLNNYNTLLDTHIEGVKTLKQLHSQNAEKIDLYKKEHEIRLEKLEEPAKAKAWLYNKYIKVIGAIGVLISIGTKIAGIW